MSGSISASPACRSVAKVASATAIEITLLRTPEVSFSVIDAMIGVVLVLGILAVVVLLPLQREYADYRSTFGLGRTGALATTMLVLPSLGCGVVASLPLSSRPPLQWVVAVVVTLAAYSLASAGLRAQLSPDPARRSR